MNEDECRERRMHKETGCGKEGERRKEREKIKKNLKEKQKNDD